jgi:hypothetical protein
MSPFAASSSAFYDCVSACDPMTVDALVMRGGRGGSKGCVDAASRPAGGGAPNYEWPSFDLQGATSECGAHVRAVILPGLSA